MLRESVATVLPLHFTKDKLKYNDISKTEFKADPILGVHFRNESVHIHTLRTLLVRRCVNQHFDLL